VNIVPVPLETVRQLPPGVYFLELEAPAGVLDRLAERPELARSIVAALVSQVGGGVSYGGSGIAWSVADGAPRRVYSIRLDVESSVTVEAGLGAWVKLAIALLAAAGFFVSGVALLRLEESELPEAIDRVADTARSVRDVALLAGGLTVAYLIARRQGWLA
jgi:hypothetical protein